MDVPKQTLGQGDGIRRLSSGPEKGRTHHLPSASQRHMLKAQSRQTAEMVSTIIRAAAFATSARTQPPDRSFSASEAEELIFIGASPLSKLHTLPGTCDGCRAQLTTRNFTRKAAQLCPATFGQDRLNSFCELNDLYYRERNQAQPTRTRVYCRHACFFGAVIALLF